MATSEQARTDASHVCGACGGTGHFAAHGHWTEPLNIPTCPVCLGAGRISDRMPAADAMADAETGRSSHAEQEQDPDGAGAVKPNGSPIRI